MSWPTASDARLVLTAWTARDMQQEQLRAEFLDLLDRRSDGVARTCADEHLTASSLVVDPTARRCLLTLHAKVGRWLQTGGHIDESDADLCSAAAREAREETGIDTLRLSHEPIQLDRHRVRCDGRELDHLDVQYVAVAAADAPMQISSESRDLAWFALDDLPPDADAAVRSLVARVRAVDLVDIIDI